MRINSGENIPSRVVLQKSGKNLKIAGDSKAVSKTSLEVVKGNEDYFMHIMSEKEQDKIMILPLTYNQKALWFLNQMDPGNISYNVSVSGKVRGAFKAEIFKSAVKILSDRHIMLRSIFAIVPGLEPSVKQIVLDRIFPFTEDADYENMPSEQVEQLINSKYRIPFDLRNGPLFKTYLFKNKDLTYFLINLHHIICDATSLKVLVNELFRIYDSLSAGKTPDLKPVKVDFADFIFEQEKFLAGEEGRTQLEYWKNYLQDQDHPLVLPYDFDRPAIQTFNGATYHFSISGELFKDMNRAALRLNVTPNALLFSVYQLVLSKLSSRKKFFIGVPFNGRTRKEFDDLFGYLINTLPVECNLQDNSTFSEIVLKSRDKLNDARKNQDIPFPVIVESVSPKRDASRPIVFQVLYNFMNKRTVGRLLDLWNPSGDEFRKFGSLEISAFALNSQEGQFDLTLEILHYPDEFTCVFKYNTDLFKSETIYHFKEEFIGLLKTIISDPEGLPTWMDGTGKDKTEKRSAINATGTFTIEPLSPAMNFWKDKLKLNSDIKFLGYNQVFQQLFNPESEFNLNKDGFNILLIRLEDLVTYEKGGDRSVKGDEQFKEFAKALSFASDINPKGKYIVAFCPESDPVSKLENSVRIIRDWEQQITDQFSKNPNIYFISSRETIENYSVKDYYEPLGEVHGHIPFTEDFYISLATLLLRKISIFNRLPVKAIAVDCDNTLWKGIVGEDGYLGIKIGRAESALQKFLVEQQAEGILICLCSKNNEADVFEVLDKNEEMILKREHISFTRINWQPKSLNLLSLSKEINIGADSFVFIDDNPSECDEVRSNLPQVVTIQKPEDDFEANYMRNSWIFDKLKITEEDRVRSKRYKEESVRTKYRSSVNSYKDFIEGLQIITDIRRFQLSDIPRVSQLTFRTNQFNFTTIRRDESEIALLSKNPMFDCLQINVSDRFGEYGLTGVIIANKNNGYVIDTFLLSCRVLGKGVEHRLIRYLGTAASENQSENIEIHFRKTSKNTPAELFLEQNFGKYRQTEGEVLQYLVPTTVALNFTFSPSLVKEEDLDEAPVKKPDLKSSQVIEFRNRFFNNVLENYLKLDKIKAAFRRTAGSYSERPSGAGLPDFGKTTQIVSSIWQEVLDRNDIKTTDNFFEIGGHSVLIPQIVINLEKRHNIKIRIVDIFQYPTIKELSGHIDSTLSSTYSRLTDRTTEKSTRTTDIAIIGMAGRFPGSDNTDEFWETIREGREELTMYSRETLEDKGVSQSILDHKNYIYASPVLTSGDKFDSSFFGFTPKEADFMDPQHRVFLEICYEAIENAGYRQADSRHSIGVFGGCGMNNYLIKNLISHPETQGTIGEMLTIINNNSDYMTTRVSYKLNFRGPSIDVQTACSTSLVAVHLACQSIINRECEIALAGGAVINVPHDEGYLYESGGILSPDGHCRPFDKEAIGTLFGEGVGAVVLKRLDEAITDHDSILAVIKGSAINNDGSQKVGYMAPGIQGQSEVIKAAIEKASIDPETISYLETHGTGTKLGDPIEIAALTQAYRKYTSKKSFCALGSVKSNIGHLDAAAGIAGLIKTVLLLKNKKLPPLTNFRVVNPELNLEDSPFFVNRFLSDWIPSGSLPRRAGVSSFGIGGTNAHCILEEAPVAQKSGTNRKYHLLPLSAKTGTGLSRQHENWIKYLKNTNENIADIAFTVQQGRETFNHRSLVFGRDKGSILNALTGKSNLIVNGEAKLSDPKIAFMFTGQGSQYIGMARDLFNDFDNFRNHIHEAAGVLSGYGIDVLEYISGDQYDETEKNINQTNIAQPLLFSVQYSLAQLLREFGINPDYLIGHSIGELTAACISGVFTYREGLILAAERGRIMQEQKPGAMLAVRLSPEKINMLLNDTIEIALYNAPELCVLSGDFDEIEEITRKIKTHYPEAFTSRLKTSHAFHSHLIEPAVEQFSKFISSFELKAPQIPIISNISGSWATRGEMQDPQYWGNQIRKPVNFVDGINEILKDENCCFIEVGPGNSLTNLLSEFQKSRKNRITSTMRHPKEETNDTDHFLRSIGKAWTMGVSIDWNNYYINETRSRIPVPTYPFEKIRHWIIPREIDGFRENDDDRTNKRESEKLSESWEIYENNLAPLERSGLTNDYLPPDSVLEKKLVTIWEELLGVSGIGITDDFFQIGGHSLLAAQVINRINEDLGADFTIEAFFKNPTISGLGLTGTFREQAVKEKDEKVMVDYTAALPLSPSQERLWIINQIDNNNPAYNISFSYILRGKLNKIVFNDALDVLFERHSVLKSTFSEKDGKPVAYINRKNKVTIVEIDLSEITEDEKFDTVQKLLETESRKRFDIQNGPLFRISLLNLDENKLLFHFTIHHLIFDGWSWGIFTKELREIYNALQAGREPDLKVLPIDYFEYSGNLQKEDLNQKYHSSIQYWKEKLAGINGHLNFPLDFNRKEIPSGEGSRIQLHLGEERSNRVKMVSREKNTTLYMLLVTAFGVLLNRYTGDQEICIGSPTANRPSSKLEKLMGLFINSVVLRLNFNEVMKFTEILKEAKANSIEAMSHQDLPFEVLVDELNPERVVNINPLFQVMFAMQNAPRPPLDLEGMTSERFFQKNGASPLDLTFYVWEENGAILGEIEFSTDIFMPETIEALKDNYITLLDNIISNPDILLKDISIISTYEQKRLSLFNQTNSFFEEKNVHQLVENIIDKYPLKRAVENRSDYLTYAELEKRSNQLAHYLISRGFNKGDTAGISMNRTPSMVIAVLGVLKAGGSYLPLDPTFPDERLYYMIEDSGAKLLITEPDYLERFSGIEITRVDYDSEQSEIAKFSSGKPSVSVDINSPAYIIYTSGSTGKSKGVKVQHRAVANFINSMSKVPGLTSEDKLLAVTTLSFDISVLEIFLPLARGATVFIAGYGDLADAEFLSAIIKEYNISVMQATPATWSLLLTSGWDGKKDLKALCGGEALPANLANDLLPRVGELWNMYGPTETTVWSTCCRITDVNRLVIGKPIDNTMIYILRDFQEQPVGAVGEVCIGGAGVSLGYHNRDELTREKFISWKGYRIYRTGDLGRYLPDGNIELFGRIDNQIKLRGFRIEPGEIENLLSQIPGIREAVVKVQKFDENDERLVAFINASSGFSLSPEEIKSRLALTLPAYMVPSFYKLSDGLPRLPNGKINKKALLLDIVEAEISQERNVGPLSPTLMKLLSVWGQALKTMNIKISDRFFDIGGNSLLGIRVINRIKEEFDINLTFRELINNPTIQLLGNLIDRQKKSSMKDVELIHLTRMKDLPLTSNQKRLWLFYKLQPEIPSYIISSTYRLRGNLNTEIFKKSIDLLFNRHHILFSVIKEGNGLPYCEIIPGEVKISFLDFTGQKKGRSESVQKVLEKDSTTAYNLEKGPLYRLYLLHTEKDEFYFHISIHHIIYDGWSHGIFTYELSQLYNSLVKGEEADLKEIQFQQYDYAEIDAHQVAGKESVSFWRETLQGSSSVLNFPYDFPRKEQSTGRGGIETIHLSVSLSEKLEQISREAGSSLFATMLSGFGVLLHKYSGEDDLNIGLPVAYRPHTALEQIFGMFVNTVVVRMKFENDQTFRDLIGQTNEAALNSISHQDLPFESVVEIVNPDRSFNTNPLFQVALAWQDNLYTPLDLKGITAEVVPLKARPPIFDITLYLWVNGNAIEGEIEYNLDILRPETISRFKNHFMTLLEKIANNTDIPIRDISMVSDEELQRLKGFNETKTLYPRDKTLVQLFEEQVKLYPDKTAVVFQDKSLTYKQLNQKANQLARTLRAVGVTNNSPVGIFAEKSLEMAVGILGIIKAGGGYVPIDPDYPDERINFIIEDSGCKVLLIQKRFDAIPVRSVRVIEIDSEDTYNQLSSDPERMNEPGDMAYIMYTSGTTGRPKGSAILQYSIIRLIRNTNYIEFTPEDKLLLTGAIVFDAFTFEFWGILLNGGTLFIVGKEVILDPEALGKELKMNKITILWLTSALFTQIAEQRTDIFTNLHYLLAGGDILSAPHINKLRRENPGIKVINGYGPTENTTFSTTYLIEKDFESNIPIGKPISNSTAFIFDKALKYQPIGIIGELYVGGDGLSAGYINRQDLNQTSFIMNPYNPGERLYKTGDLARWLPDGNIEFHGRADNQLKIRGFRVELEEIEAIVSDLDDVIETVVKPLKVREGDYRLVAFLNVRDSFIMNNSDILGQIRTKLPSYMLPSTFKLMHGFPKTINGKTDRKALVTEPTEFAEDNVHNNPDFSPIEKIIYRIWVEALKISDISLTDNFFVVGGNSLLAISVMSAIESEFKLKLGLKTFFDSPKIRDLANVIDIELRRSAVKKHSDKKPQTHRKVIKGEI